jgi:hypothetical protein
LGSVSIDALFHRGDELARHHAALDGVDELEALARLLRFDLQHHVTVLALAARLAHELAFDVGHRLADGLAVGHLRLADVGLDAELALHAVDDDFQVQLAHAGDDGLATFLVGAHAERRIFGGQAAQRDAHLLLVGLGLGLDGLRDHGLGEDHLLERDDRIRVAQGLARGHVLQAHAGGDVAGQDFLDLFTLVGVHLQDPADALLLAADRVVDRVARLQHARVDAHEGQLADVGVGHQLEGQRGELLCRRHGG